MNTTRRRIMMNTTRRRIMMNKTLHVLFLLFVVGTALAISASTTVAQEVVVSTGSVEALPGTTLQMPIDLNIPAELSDAQELGSLTVSVSYDPTLLTINYSQTAYGSIIASTAQKAFNVPTPGDAKLGITATYGMGNVFQPLNTGPDGTIIDIGFDVNSSANVGDSCTFGIYFLMVANGTTEVSSSANNGTFTVSEEAAPANIVINEFVANPSSGNDWVELYNPGSSDISLDGWALNDSTSQIKSLGGTINASGYRVFEVSNRLGMNDDTITLLNGTAVVEDNVTYGAEAGNAPVPTTGKSTGRYPNGADTDVDSVDFSIFSTPTYGAENVLEDTTYPVVNTVDLNTTTPNTGDAILVTVNATDNVAVTSVTADGVELTAQGYNIWNGTITAIEGVNSVNVSAKDAAGNTGWNNSTSYTATTPNLPPIAVITSPTASGEYHVGDEVSFYAAGSSDPDGTIAMYNWTFGDGNISTGETTNHTYTTAGSMTVTLTVTDNEGATNTTNVTINVLETGAVPVTLYVGWNLVSWVNATDTTAEGMADDITNCTHVVKWDNQDKEYISHPEGYTTNNFVVARGYGYWAHVDNNSTWVQTP